MVKAQLLNGRDYHLAVWRENQLVFSRETSGLIQRMLWLDEATLLVLDQQHLSVINLIDNSEQVLLDAKESGLNDVIFDPLEQRLLGLYQSIAAERVFRELDSLQDRNRPFERVINTPAGSRMLHYTEHDAQFFVIVKNESSYNLIQFDQHSGNQQVLFSSELRPELLDYHFAQGALLLKAGWQLLVVVPTDGSVQVVSTSQILLEHHATFSMDGKRVYFGQQVGGVWELHQFDRVSQRQSLLARGYLSIREINEGFIAATATGELQQLDSDFNMIRSLDHSINTQLISRWHVKNQQVIWSDFDFITTSINQLDLASGELGQFSLPYETMLPRFALNHDGSRMLVYGLGEVNTELREFKLPPLSLKKEG